MNTTRAVALLLSLAGTGSCQHDIMSPGAAETGGAAVGQAGGPSALGGSKPTGGSSDGIEHDSTGAGGAGDPAGAPAALGGSTPTGGSSDGLEHDSAGVGGAGDQAGAPAALGGSTPTGGSSDGIEYESAGSGGVDGQAGSSDGGSVTYGTDDCGTHAPLEQLLWPLSPLVSSGADDACESDCPAVVERSADAQLVLAIGGGVAGAGGADSSASLPTHFSMDWSGVEFPAGAQLSVSRYWNSPLGRWGSPAWALSVRDPDGVLLFGAFSNAATQPAAPVSIGAVTPGCTALYASNCYPDATVTYNQVEVNGDATVVLGDGERATLALNGIPYDVDVTSRDYGGNLDSTVCYDRPLQPVIALNVCAQDLASRVSALPVGTLPACAVGNDPDPAVIFHFDFDDPFYLDEGFDLTVSYVGRDARPDSLDFEIPNMPGAKLSIERAGRLLPEPPVGQQLWLSHTAEGNNALLEAEGGALLLAAVGGDLQPAVPSAALQSVLGVKASTEQSCLYAAENGDETWLWDFVFGTTPPARVSTGSAATLDLDGQPYVAWFWGQRYSYWLVLYRGP
ncbi:MAG: hypothetical protein JW940_13770 [Polyangiaceae bacterium]|nr:hypothetical protein [Polyangiaceae bacterium]